MIGQKFVMHGPRCNVIGQKNVMRMTTRRMILMHARKDFSIIHRQCTMSTKPSDMIVFMDMVVDAIEIMDMVESLYCE